MQFCDVFKQVFFVLCFCYFVNSRCFISIQFMMTRQQHLYVYQVSQTRKLFLGSFFCYLCYLCKFCCKLSSTSVCGNCVLCNRSPCVAAFSLQSLHCFMDTIRPSDSLHLICLPCLIIACMAYHFIGRCRVSRVTANSQLLTCRALRLRRSIKSHYNDLTDIAFCV